MYISKMLRCYSAGRLGFRGRNLSNSHAYILVNRYGKLISGAYTHKTYLHARLFRGDMVSASSTSFFILSYRILGTFDCIFLSRL